MGRLLERLKRRKLVSWGVAYLASAWLIVQVADVIGDKFLWPLRLQQGLIVLLGLGLPVVLVLAWYHGEKGRQRVSGTEFLLIGGLLALGGTALAFWGPPGAPEGSPAASEAASVMRLVSSELPSIAVLPFLPLGAEPPSVGAGADRGGEVGEGESPGGDDADRGASFFAAGMHDDLLTQLAKIGSLTILSRTSVMQYKGTTKTIPTIGRELGVDAILEGGIRRAGDRIRVSVQLIHARTDEHLWAETYDRRLTVEDVLTIQGEIASLVARELEVTLTREEADRIGRTTTGSLAAYERYLEARDAIRRRTRDDNERGIELLRQAIDVDSTYARAWAGMGAAYVFRHFFFGAPAEWVDSARVAAERALELQPDLAEGYHALGLAHIASGEFGKALELNLRAVELSPSFDAAVNNVGVLHHSFGRFDEAMGWIRRASRLAPGSPFLRTNIAGLYIHLGEYELASEILGEIEEENPASPGLLSQRVSLYRAAHALDSLVVVGQRMAGEREGDPRAHFTAAAAALDGGRPDLARIQLREVLRLAPEGELWDEDAHQAHTLAAFLALEDGPRSDGSRDSAREHLEAAERFVSAAIERGTEDPWYRWEMGTLRVLERDPEDALSWFRAAFDGGWRDHRWPAIDPLLEGLRDDPRFGEILGAIRADVEGQRRRLERSEIAAGLR